MKIKEASKELIHEAFNSCQGYFKTHKTLSVDFRIAQLKKLKRAIVKYEPLLLDALKSDLNKSSFEAYETEIGFSLKSLSDAIKGLRRWAGDIFVKTPYYIMPAKSRTIYEPYGTVLIMSPFNYPFQLLIEPLIGAISAGNCVILKPSELAPCTSRVVSKIISESFPSCYIKCIEGGIETNKILLELSFDYIFFTGSISVGKIVMAAAAKNLTPVTLELGGKSPVIVDESANIKWAAKRIIWGKTINAGQTCIAPDYAIVHESVKDRLIEEMKKCIMEFYGKNPQSSQYYGRIVNSKHFNRLKNILKADKEFIIHGGEAIENEKYIEPSLMLINSTDCACMQEEIFGPILPILTYSDFSEIETIIDKMPTPLALYIFSRRSKSKQALTRLIRAGGVCINDTIEHIATPNLPFGGIKSSGMGSYHGKESFITFSHNKSVLERYDFPVPPFLTPPYSETGLRLLRKILK